MRGCWSWRNAFPTSKKRLLRAFSLERTLRAYFSGDFSSASILRGSLLAVDLENLVESLEVKAWENVGASLKPRSSSLSSQCSLASNSSSTLLFKKSYPFMAPGASPLGNTSLMWLYGFACLSRFQGSSLSCDLNPLMSSGKALIFRDFFFVIFSYCKGSIDDF